MPNFIYILKKLEKKFNSFFLIQKILNYTLVFLIICQKLITAINLKYSCYTDRPNRSAKNKSVTYFQILCKLVNLFRIKKSIPQIFWCRLKIIFHEIKMSLRILPSLKNVYQCSFRIPSILLETVISPAGSNTSRFNTSFIVVHCRHFGSKIRMQMRNNKHPVPDDSFKSCSTSCKLPLGGRVSSSRLPLFLSVR